MDALYFGNNYCNVVVLFCEYYPPEALDGKKNQEESDQKKDSYKEES